VSHDHQQRFLGALDAKMIASGLAASDEAMFDLDFHAVMHWGHDPALESTTSRRNHQRRHRHSPLAVPLLLEPESRRTKIIYGGKDQLTVLFLESGQTPYQRGLAWA
jgi:hypothetical protein